MNAAVHCSNCGAPASPQADVRVFACAYCGAEVQVAIDGAQLAVGLGLDRGTIDQFLVRLAASLAHGLGDRTRIERMGEQIVLLELNLDPDLFVARRDRGGIELQHRKMVRGIAIKTKRPDPAAWVELLSTALADHANSSAHAARVLAQLRLA
jgi:hypothetical protein